MNKFKWSKSTILIYMFCCFTFSNCFGNINIQNYWSKEFGLFYAPSQIDFNPDVGKYEDITVQEYGISIGGTYHMDCGHSICFWGDLGCGGFSQFFLSHFAIGSGVLFGNNIKKNSIGPCVSIGSQDIMIGFQWNFKFLFCRALFNAYNDIPNPIESKNYFRGKISIGVSI
jgi:hypothetical protein